MLNDCGMYQGYSVEGVKEAAMPSAGCGMAGDPGYGVGAPGPVGTVSSPVYEGAQERQIHRSIVHEVPHVCPINTRIINHHIFKHTYSPCYTCCEENVCSNVQCGSCCNF